MSLVLFGLTWLYLFYNAKKQAIKKPWIFVLIIICAALTSSYFSFATASVRISPLAIIVTILLFYGPKEFKNDLFDCVGLHKSLLISTTLGILFSVILVEYGSDLHQNLSLPLSGKVLYILQNTIAEELLFRGFFISYLLAQKIKPGLVIFIQTLCFLSGHFYWFSNSTGLLYFIFSGLFATIAGYIVIKYKNIIGPLLMHLLINLSFLFS